MNLIKLTTPINIAEEKKKFFQSKEYNPILKYDFKGVKPFDSPKNPKESLINAILLQNHEGIVDAAQKLFKTDLTRYIKEANAIVANCQPEIIPFDLKDIQEQFDLANGFFNLGYKLLISDVHGFNFRPNYKIKTLLMSKHANLDYFSARGEIQHEFTHIVRYENHKYNQLKQSDAYLPTEEGLATLMQDSSRGVNYSEFQHAAEYLASDIGLKGSLRDIFDFFVDSGFSAELAWQRAIRHKFGFEDTTKPGDIIKPAMYFENSQDIACLPIENVLMLFQGRVSIEDIDQTRDKSGLLTGEKIAEFFDYFN